MNLGRFHAAIYTVKWELETNKISNLLNSLFTALQQSVSSANENTGNEFKKSYAQLQSALRDARSNRANPTRLEIYKEIGATQRIGNGLLATIESIINRNQITPATALTELKDVVDDVALYLERIVSIEDNLENLNIEYEELKAGEFEIGFALPHELVGTTLGSLVKEFKEIDFVLKTLQEVVGEKAASPIVKQISSSEWQLFLDSAPVLGAALTHAIERIYRLYKNHLEIKLIQKQLEEKDMPETVTTPLKDHLETIVSAKLRELAEEIVDEYYKDVNDSRKNELKTKTSIALRYIADRMDRGGTIEVHASLPKKPEAPVAEDEEQGEASVVDPEVLEQYEKDKALVLKVNEIMTLTHDMTKSDEATLSIEYKSEEEQKSEDDAQH